MVQRDYILRQIEQLGMAYGALVRSAEERKGLQYRVAGEPFDQALRQHFGLDAETVRARPAEDLIGTIRLESSAFEGPGVVADKLALLAALVREQADLDAAQGDDDEAAIGRLKSVQLFLTALVDEGASSDFAARAIDPLLELLAAYELPREVKELLWRYAEQTGEYARAEDWLFVLLDNDPDALDAGIAFYERLGHFSDEELARGNLPRAEVAAGLAELRERRGGAGA
jgi:hypothetical protein